MFSIIRLNVICKLCNSRRNIYCSTASRVFVFSCFQLILYLRIFTCRWKSKTEENSVRNTYSQHSREIFTTNVHYKRRKTAEERVCIYILGDKDHCFNTDCFFLESTSHN